MKVYHTSGNEALPSLPLNVNDMSFSEEGIWSIPTNQAEVLPYTQYDTTRRDEWFAKVNEILGEDIHTLYGIFDLSTQKTIEILNLYLSYFPSIPLSFPSLFENALSVTALTYHHLIYYIPALKRCIVNSNRSTGIASGIYSVDNNGDLSRISTQFVSVNRLNSGLTSANRPDMLYESLYILGYTGVGPPTIDQFYYFSNSLNAQSGTATLQFTKHGSAASVEFLKIFEDFSPPDYNIPVNPYEPGGESGPGGGNGSFDDDSDPIPIPSLPTLSSANTGFTRIYNPTLSQVQALANYLWTDESVIQTIWNHVKQFFENPMDAIIGLNLVPVPVPDGGTKNFALMYIDTGVSMTVAASQFVDVDCGILELKEYYGSALDYSPYTKITCYLPYIGQVTLDVDEVMGRTLQVTYRVDICSGSCVAYILVDGNAIYQYSGHCAINIPISSADFSSYVSAAISVAKLAGTAIAGGVNAIAPPAIEAASQQTNKVVTTTVNTQRNPSTGRQITVGTQTTTVEKSANESGNTEASFGGIMANQAVNTASQVMSSKTIVEHTGSFSGNSGYLGVRRPYIIIERPNMCMPVDYQKFNGFPSMITLLLGECTGFTRVQQVQLTGLHCTNPEQAEILELLKMGVIF